MPCVTCPWMFNTIWTDVDITWGHDLLLFRLHVWDGSWICLEYVLMWESPSMEKVGTSALCLARPCVLSCNANHTFADGGCLQEHQLKKSKRISLSPGWTSPQLSHCPLPSNQSSHPDKETRCWVILVFPRCEMASLNAHEISAENRFGCHF